MSAITLAILLSALTGPSASVPSGSPHAPTDASTLATKDASGTGRFDIRVGLQNGAWLNERFRDTLWQLDVRLHEYKGQSPRSLEAYLASPEYSTAKQRLAQNGILNVVLTTHTWVFDAPDTPGGMTARALELEDLSGPDGYHVRATMHCYDTPELCKAFHNRQTPLLAPKPVATAGDLALRQWRNRVNAEACTVFAKNMRQPQYPASALREGIEGYVLVGIVFNTCGNVRDAWIQKSSGNRELDRAAQIQALKWQIDIQSLPKTMFEPGRAVVPVKFLLGDEPTSGVLPLPIK